MQKEIKLELYNKKQEEKNQEEKLIKAKKKN